MVAAGVDPEHDLGVEYLQQRLEISCARGGKERVDDPALPGEVAVRRRAAPRTRRRPRLASCRAAAGLRSTIGAISSNDTPNMSCSTNASRSAGVSSSSTTSSASPTVSASSACCAGSVASSSLTTGSGIQVPTYSSLRVRRARSMSMQIRPTTVVSQPPRFVTSPCQSGSVAATPLGPRPLPLRPSRASGRRSPAGAAAAARTGARRGLSRSRRSPESLTDERRRCDAVTSAPRDPSNPANHKSSR